MRSEPRHLTRRCLRQKQMAATERPATEQPAVFVRLGSHPLQRFPVELKAIEKR